MEFLHLFMVVFGLCGSCFYSGIETGTFSINRVRLQHLVRKKDRAALILNDFLENPDHLLGTTLVGNNLCNILLSVGGMGLGAHYLGENSAAISYAVITLTVLTFGEYLPKSWFQAAPIRRSRPMARILEFNGRVFYPLSRAATWLASVLVPAGGKVETKKVFQLTRDELLRVAEHSMQSGEFSQDEKTMLRAVFTLDKVPCQKVMIPRSGMVVIEESAKADQILAVAQAHSFRWFPVHQTGTDVFTGILYIQDFLSDPRPGRKTAKDYMRTPLRIEETTPAEDALPRMRLNRQPALLVTDNAGRVVGLLTLTDVLKVITRALEPRQV